MSLDTTTMYSFSYLLIKKTTKFTLFITRSSQWVQVVRISHEEHQGPSEMRGTSLARPNSFCLQLRVWGCYGDLSDAGGSSHVSSSVRTAYCLWNAGRANQSLSGVWTCPFGNIWCTSMILRASVLWIMDCSSSLMVVYFKKHHKSAFDHRRGFHVVPRLHVRMT